MEAGEAQGRGGSWQSWNVICPQWIGTGKISPLVQAGLAPYPDPAVKGVPMLVDVVPASYKPIAKLLSASVAMSRIVGTPPSIPEGRLAGLRKAFLEAMKDPKFLADVKKRKMDLSVLTGEQVEANIAELMKTPKDILKRTAETLGYNNKKKSKK